MALAQTSLRPSLETSGAGRALAVPFSLMRYSPYLILVLVMVADTNRYADPDLWGHIRFGQAILATRHLPIRDPYSYSAAGYLWRDHEWLSEVVIAGFYGALGVVGLKLMKVALCAATVI